MNPTEIICPSCGAATRPGRRCRKCAAPLPDSASAPPQTEPSFQVTLVSTTPDEGEIGRDTMSGDPLLARLNAPRQYHLAVTDAAGQTPTRLIPVPGKCGMSLGRWTLTRQGAQTILSAYFYVNASGHDLDMWLHYDLDTGQSLGMGRGDECDPDPARHLRDQTENQD